MHILRHLHPAIIHFPIVLFLLAASARIFSKKVPAPLIQLLLLFSIAAGFLALITGLLAAGPLTWATLPNLLRLHMILALTWWILACYLYFTFAKDTWVSLTIWLFASVLLLATATLGGAMVHGW